ncbi:hypothetical protein LZ683_09630 [Comamonas testosteroni]|uniref:hypothetical protein n=1 Tax=Comamonas testosteroni TaxID=285 RepID=UPI0023AA34D7|nr:hypothetical protein [Comamonas testosteroni]WEE79592.1 hypothetical protein LZ683_09630 [Comamonas testosteroni]
MRNIIAFTLACALSACGSADSGLIGKTQKAVQTKLKDPDSAKFGEAFVVTPEEQSTIYSDLRRVCGDVSAKNSYGAYEGRIRFVGLLGKAAGSKDLELLSLEIEPAPGNSVFQIVHWDADCKRQTAS